MKEYKYILIFSALAILILWQALLPGYILGLDMVFAPEMKVVVNPDGFSNFLPVGYLIYWLSFLIPVWLVQKLILFILFFSIGYLSFKYFPFGNNIPVRLFSALIYLANPFVYSRFLAGQWTHLVAYALLPPFVHFLFKLGKENNLKSALKLFGVLFLISVFSIHFFIMASIIVAFLFVYMIFGYLAKAERGGAVSMVKNMVICGALFLIVSSYWLIPALNRPEPLEGRFDIAHWQAFSASGYKDIGPLLNVVSLNGFWGEGEPWAGYFLWPQDYALFWFSFLVILGFILLGIINGLRDAEARPRTIFFLSLGVVAVVFSLGTSETVFKGLNQWLYENISFWSGFRDSQKFSGLLALSYAVLAGMGFSGVTTLLERQKPVYKEIFISVIFIIPVLFGFLVWGGFHKQIRPVWYPDSWIEAREMLDADNTEYKTLFLPWHGYLSLNFNNNVISSNPARRFFGDNVIAGKNVELDDIYDQEESGVYREIDNIVRNPGISTEERIEFLQRQGIKYIIYVKDLEEVDYISYSFLSSPKLEIDLENEDLIVFQARN